MDYKWQNSQEASLQIESLFIQNEHSNIHIYRTQAPNW